MTDTRTVAVVTGTRAEYGLLKPVMEGVRRSDGLALRTLVTGSHLEPRFGETWREIVGDGFEVDARIPILGTGDALEDVASALGEAVSGLAHEYASSRPDAVVVLGDRYEAFGAVAAAFMMRIPVAHISGGELTFGALDDGLRHAMTKLSHWHFAATDEYGRRIVQMGESPERVHVVGALGVDCVRRTELLSRDQLEESIGFALGEHYVMVTFHPETLEADLGLESMRSLMRALDARADLRVLFTMPNADSGTEAIAEEVRRFVESHAGRAVLSISLGQHRYLSAVAHALAVVGNSSSGIIEAPSLGVPTVNIGSRQDGRTRAASVIDCPGEESAILDALNRATSEEFLEQSRQVESPFGDGHAAERIVDVLERELADGVEMQKRFHDLGASGSDVG